MTTTAENCPYSVDKLWTLRKWEIINRRLLRNARQGDRNTFTVGNGHRPGATSERGRDRETGIFRGCLALADGSRHWAVRQLSARSRAARQGPLHLIHGGGLVIFCPNRSVSLAHRVTVKGHGVLASGAQADVARHVPQEIVRIELAPQAVDIGLVLA